MKGRVRRRLAREALDALPPPAAEPPPCALCGRPLGKRVEWHHVVPKSQGGRDTAPVHPICHRTIHASASNAELARLVEQTGDLSAVRDLPAVARFVAWVADKPPDFNAPTRRARG